MSTLMLGYLLDIIFCKSIFQLLLFFSLTHFYKSSPTLPQERYFRVFHELKKRPEMHMDLDLNLAAF